ncbi:phosphoserine phosphatase SerB [Pseudomonas putida S11]|nr:phosphoserine phosphatase SerB [Pseudomonas putida S11]
MREIVLINITGEDRPGLTAAITGVLLQGGVSILDIGLAVMHGTLSFGILVDIPDNEVATSLLQSVQAKGPTKPEPARPATRRISEADYQHVGRWPRARRATSSPCSAARSLQSNCRRGSAVISRYGLTIERIERLSARVALDAETDKGKAAIEISVRGVPSDAEALRADFFALAEELSIDIAFQKDDLFRRNRRLAVFDMDSTLIEAEVIDELAKAAGVGEQVAAITERAMRGELDFRASFKERMALLKGLDVGVLDEIGASLRLTEGAENLFAELKRLGYKTAILSGGFTYFARQVQARLGIDYVFANELEVVDGKVTGVAVEPIVDAQRKAELLQKLASEEGLQLEQTIAVGDGANDLPMLSLAGLGVAFRAKPLVRQSAKQAISTLGLDGVLYLLGLRDRDARG